MTASPTPPQPCDPEVFKTGAPIALADCRMHAMEAWVALVRESSGQRVDWHYSGGIAQVLFLGDRGKVRDAIRLHESAFGGEWVKVIAEGEPGLYRARVTVID